jgi:hypothetical protein
LVGTEPPEECVFSQDEILECTIDPPTTTSGEADSNRPGVFGVWCSTNESSLLEVIETVGHRSRSHQRVREELSR